MADLHSRPLDDFEGADNKNESGRKDPKGNGQPSSAVQRDKENPPDNITLEQQIRHRPHVHVVDLTYLRQLQRRRRARQEEADYDEYRII